MRKDQMRAFTLIELLIVVVILGILVAIAVPRFRQDKARARVELLRSELRRVADAQGSYLAAHQRYAPDLAALSLTPKPGVTIRIGGTGLDAGAGWNATAQGEAPDLVCYLGVGGDTVLSGATVHPSQISCRNPMP
jgi:prepilin-type N-terminal cleavage/methylation domain-containing protein